MNGIVLIAVVAILVYLFIKFGRVYVSLLAAYVRVWVSGKKNRGAREVYRGAVILLYGYRKDLLELPCRVGKSLQLIVHVPTEDDVRNFDPVLWFKAALEGRVEAEDFNDIVDVLREVAGLEEDYAQQLAEDTSDVSKFPATPPRAVLPKIHFYVKGWKAVPVDSFQNIDTETRFGEDYYVEMPTQEEVEALSNDTGAEAVTRDDVDLGASEYMQVLKGFVGEKSLD